MKKQYVMLFLVSGLLLATATAEAQVMIGGRIGGGYGYGYGHVGGGYRRRPQSRAPRQTQPKFQPVVYASFGYGFPNLDANQFPEYYNLYKGSISQTGLVTGALDYRFSRYTSIGVMATYGKVNVPYYSYNSPSSLVEKGSLENWSVMLNLMQYTPISNTATMYLRGAIGVNSWNNNFTDGSGAKVPPPFTPSLLAYQVGIGARFNIAENMALFAEAGYGKYILHGGLSFSFH
ncbi:hypothetical protein [Parasediminibacterium sp. JCM 36343]|uniref:hypothetical protein n=1 Tax=Parasediminibacterium sp. JCM 36343 TaxID=3374279 RepID=UPI00397C4CDD